MSYTRELEAELQQEVCKLIRELGITYIVCDFHCGHDSMNEFRMNFIRKDSSGVENNICLSFFPDLRLPDEKLMENEFYAQNHNFAKKLQDAVLNGVKFYEASDGHYIGEYGTVEVYISEKDENRLRFIKKAKQEFDEEIECSVWINFTDEEIRFLQTHVTSMWANAWEDYQTEVNYKHDFVFSGRMEEIEEDIAHKLRETLFSFDFTETPEFREGIMTHFDSWDEQEKFDSGGWAINPENLTNIEVNGNAVNCTFSARFWCFGKYSAFQGDTDEESTAPDYETVMLSTIK